MNIGETVARLRAERGWTLQQVADLSGFTKSHIWEIENGRSANPTIRLVIGLADAFGCSIDELIGRQTSKPKVPEHLGVAIAVCRELYAKGVQEGKRRRIDRANG